MNLRSITISIILSLVVAAVFLFLTTEIWHEGTWETSEEGNISQTKYVELKGLDKLESMYSHIGNYLKPFLQWFFATLIASLLTVYFNERTS